MHLPKVNNIFLVLQEIALLELHHIIHPVTSIDMILFYMSRQLPVDAIKELIIVNEVICNGLMNSYQF